MAAEDGQIYYGHPEQPGDIGPLYHSRQRLTARILTGSPLSPHTSLTSRVLTYLADPSKPAHLQKPAVPVLFFKPTSALAGPGQDMVVPRLARGEKNDYEVELCVVIGRDCRDVTEEEAMDYIAGYTVVNDVSSRGLCGKGLQWGMAKAFDSWCPIGPVLVSASALGRDPHALPITTRINGQLVQKASTAGLVLPLPKLISRLSHGATLQAGSLILTGSPVAIGRTMPGDVIEASPFMKHGDEVWCFVESCGTLINTVREEGVAGGAKAKL
ncbi:hypothetical protein JCM11641_000318 [Rhodosporidiobolus odoratus]